MLHGPATVPYLEASMCRGKVTINSLPKIGGAEEISKFDYLINQI